MSERDSSDRFTFVRNMNSTNHTAAAAAAVAVQHEIVEIFIKSFPFYWIHFFFSACLKNWLISAEMNFVQLSFKHFQTKQMILHIATNTHSSVWCIR